jgi:hypothetical protein
LYLGNSYSEYRSDPDEYHGDIHVLDEKGCIVDHLNTPYDYNYLFSPPSDGVYYIAVYADKANFGKYNFHVEEAASISGKVSDVKGRPLSGIVVQYFDVSKKYSREELSESVWGWDYVLTDKQGNYKIEGLFAGNYKLRVSNCNYSYSTDPKYRLKYWNNKSTTYAKADIVNVLTGVDVTGKDVKLEKNSYPGGTKIQNLPYSGKGKLTIKSGEVLTEGKDRHMQFLNAKLYNVKLRAGKSYKISVSSKSLGESKLVSIFYNGSLVAGNRAMFYEGDLVKPFTPEKTVVYQVAVASDKNHYTGNFNLNIIGVKTGGLKGIARNLEKKKTAGVTVIAYSKEAYWLEVDRTVTNKSGKYFFSGLLPGKYKLAFYYKDFDYEIGYRKYYYTGKYDDGKGIEKAKTITVKAGKTKIINENEPS